MTHDDLRKAAEAATPGEWDAVLPDDPRGQPVPYYKGLICLVEHSEPGALAVVTQDGRLVRREEWAANTTYIALANPSRILALLDDNAAKDARIAELMEALRPFANVTLNLPTTLDEKLKDNEVARLELRFCRAAAKAYGGGE